MTRPRTRLREAVVAQPVAPWRYDDRPIWRLIPARLEAPPGPGTPKSLHRVTPARPRGPPRPPAATSAPSGSCSNIETAIHNGEWVDPAGGRMTVAELAEHWQSSDPSKRSSTKARDEAILRIHVLPTLGPRRLREVTPPDIQRLVNAWTQLNAPRTVDRQYDVVRAVFAYAVRSDWLATTRCRGIRLPAVTATRRRALEPDDIIRLAEAIDARYEAMVWVGAVLGLRWAEVAGLTVGWPPRT